MVGHDDKDLPVVGFADIMNDADILMVQCGRGSGFVDKAVFCFGFSGQIGREELQGDGAVKLEVLGLVNNTHASTAEVLEDLVVRNRLTEEWSHDSSFRARDGNELA